jgi:hypothetical protein
MCRQRNDDFSATPACGTLAVVAVDVYYSTPFRLSPSAQRAFLVLCDHGSNAVPERYGSLGLSAKELERHIGLGYRGARHCARIGREARMSGHTRRWHLGCGDQGRAPRPYVSATSSLVVGKFATA